MIEFTAVDSNNETITYSAVDVTDGNIPFLRPAPSHSAARRNPDAPIRKSPRRDTSRSRMRPDSSRRTSPIAVSATADAPVRTGWLSTPSGNLFVADLVNGNLYKFPPGGGVANNSTLVGTVGPSLAGLVFDSSGHLFAARNATTGDYTTGAVIQLNPANASVIQTLATIPCAEPLSIDPLSGDLFTDDACGGGGTNTSLWRIASPATSPTLSVYATLPSAPNANIGFAPNGTMYVFVNSQIVQVTGTNGPNPPVVTTIPSIALYYLGLLAYGSQTNGDAQYLIANLPPNTGVNPNVPSTTSVVDLTTSPPSIGATIIANGGGGNMITGPDGCIYMSLGGGGVWKITDTTGACHYTGTPAPSISLTPTTLASNPQQGTPQTFTARFHNVTVADGTSVLLGVTGANTEVYPGQHRRRRSLVHLHRDPSGSRYHFGLGHREQFVARLESGRHHLGSRYRCDLPYSQRKHVQLGPEPGRHRDREPDGSIGESSGRACG